MEKTWYFLAKEQDNVVLTEYEKQVLDERLASLDANSDTLLSWDEMKSKIRS
jgi:putative addiction module component (TIGR02574 family)